MMQLSGSIRYEFSQSRRLLFTSSTRAVYEIVDPKQTPTAGVAITSRIKKLNFPPFIKVNSSTVQSEGSQQIFISGYFLWKI